MPEVVSQRLIDRVKVNLSPEMFRDDMPGDLIIQQEYMEQNEEDFSKRYSLTKQYPDGLKETTDAVVGAVRNSILTFFGANIALSFLAV